jgi:lipid-A-disaccharide synthase
MASEVRSVFILAGEPSGDRLGAYLVRRLRERIEVTLSGVGSDALVGEGLRSLYPMHDLSVMGLWDVLERLPLLLWRARQTVKAILRAQPDIVILVDAQVFSATIAKRLRKAGFQKPILLYVAPAVYAWRPERAPGLRRLYDEILAVLPLEPAVMARLGGPPTTYVGHPATAAMPMRRAMPAAGPLLLLPGSRQGELKRDLPMIREVAESLAGHPRLTGFVLPTPDFLRPRIEAEVATWKIPVSVVTSETDKIAAFEAAVGAIAVIGTVTLELALRGVPMVVTHVWDNAQAWGVKKYQVRFTALPNIVIDRMAVPELLSTEPDVLGLIRTTRQLLDEPAVAAAQVEAFGEIRRLMEQGMPGAPLVDPVDRVLARLGLAPTGARSSASGR